MGKPLTATMTPLSMPVHARSRWVRADVLAAVAIALAAMVFRAGHFGDPLAGFDEQFYLLVGDGLRHGALPYVDVWDRKPVGLFVVFALIRLLPGDGVLASQIVGTLFAATTAWVVALIARRRADWPAATMAGVLYLAGLGELWGATTQSPVFYNLPVAIAAWLVLFAAERPVDRAPAATLAMLLVGLAIQIKTNAIFPGTLFGTWFAHAHWRATRSTRATGKLLAWFAMAGAVPTIAAAVGYAALGHFAAWWQANVLSVLAKGRPTDEYAIATLVQTAVLFAPVAVLALLGLYRRTSRLTRWSAESIFAVAWVLVSIVDFAAVGSYFPHYAPPLLLACCPLAASAFAVKRWGPALFALAMAWPLVDGAWLAPRVTAMDRVAAARVMAALPADVRSRCLFIYEGPAIYYHLSHACTVTRYLFTAHLSSEREASALGVDPAAELRATMDRRPGTVLTVRGGHWPDRDPRQARLLADHLHAHYRVAAVLPHLPAADRGDLVMWRLR